MKFYAWAKTMLGEVVKIRSWQVGKSDTSAKTSNALQKRVR
jgi:hypothetical protein